MHQESAGELIVVLLGGHGAQDSWVVAVLMLAALLNREKWGEEERQENRNRQKGATSLEGNVPLRKAPRKEDTWDSSPL